MNTIKPGLDYGEALREEHDDDRMGTVPQVPRDVIHSSRKSTVPEVPAVTGPVLGNEADDIEIGAEDPFVLPEETVMLGLARVAEIKSQLAARKAARSS